MNETKKSIVIDSSSLIGGGASGTKRKSRRSTSGSGERKIRPSSIVQPSTLKKSLLERIKQHQRIRERSRETYDDGGGGGGGGDGGGGSGIDSNSGSASASNNDNFTQSMNFLKELALKRRTQRRSHLDKNKTDSDTESKTPEAKLLNQVSETLHNGEILTNTGLLGLPVVPMLSSQIATQTPGMTAIATPVAAPVAAPVFTMPEQPIRNESLPTVTAHPARVQGPPPKLTELADMYNNTVASVDVPEPVDTPPLHIPQKPEDYMPSIFIKEDPPHGCLKQGKKPTFREWVGKILGDNRGTQEGQGEGQGEGQEQGLTSGNNTTQEQNDDSRDENVSAMRVKIRKTKKKSYRIGKHDNVVGVLLKNKQTQRHIQNQHLTLRQKTIGEIRKYLYDHHLLKIGSNAPPDVLRRMYEDAILTGDVKNTNDNVMLHNFMAGGGGE